MINYSAKTLSGMTMNQYRMEYSQVFQEWTTGNIKTLMGLINYYIYCLCVKWEVSTPMEEFTPTGVKISYEQSREKLLELVSASIDGLVEVSTSVLKMQEYLKKYWEGACSSPQYIRKMREFMRDELGLFAFIPQIKGSTVIPPNMEKIDVIRMLAVFEACEHELAFRYPLPEGARPGEELEQFMPKHKAAFVVNVFNTFFQGLAKYRRVQEDVVQSVESAELPEVERIPSNEVTWQWQHWYKIPKVIWNAMIKRAQKVFGDIVKVDESEPINWDAVAVQSDKWMTEQMQADIPY